jgi:hypothetical protein
MEQPGRVFGIGCRLCGKASGELGSVALAASWYLEHAVTRHWDLARQLHDATPEQRAQARVLAAIRGWYQDVLP